MTTKTPEQKRAIRDKKNVVRKKADLNRSPDPNGIRRQKGTISRFEYAIYALEEHAKNKGLVAYDKQFTCIRDINLAFKKKLKSRSQLVKFAISEGVIDETKGDRQNPHIKTNLPFGASSGFLSTSSWILVRDYVLKLLGRKCCKCNHEDQTGLFYVSHIKSRFEYPKEALDLNNLQVLCPSCHKDSRGTDFRTEEQKRKLMNASSIGRKSNAETK